MQRYVWRVFCPSSNQYETTISDTEPTVCPSDGVTPVDPTLTTIMQSEFYDVISRGYVNVESQLADNQAIKINASDTNGGIDINAGLGGITVDTTNAVQINAAAASNFTTSNGNLTLLAVLGLLNLDSGSGINIGNGATSIPILIGTTPVAKNITIGNQTSTATTNIRAGTGGFNVDTANGGPISLDATGAISNFTLSTNGDGQDLILALLGNTDSSLSLQSSGTGTDAINLVTSAGGILLTSPTTISLGTDFSGTGSIRLSSGPGGSGSLILEAGAAGIAINSYNGGAIGIGHFNGGDIFLGTAAVARTITIGNGTDSTRLFERFGTGGLIQHQDAPTVLADSNATLTITQLLTRILNITPSANRTLTLPTAADVIAGVPGAIVSDSIDFTIINLSVPPTAANIVLAAGTGGAIIGNPTIFPRENNTSTIFSSGSAVFRLRITSGAYELYRIS